MADRYGVAVVFVLAAVLTGPLEAAESRPSKKIALFSLHGPFVEAPRGLSFSLSGEERGSLREFVGRLHKAAKDDALVGVSLLLEEPVLGWAQTQEIRAAIDLLRANGKEVHCHLASVDERSYMVAAACHRIAVVPGGEVDLTGLVAEGLYFKGLLDKLGIVADLEHCGAYKGSAEPYTRTGPSKERQEQMQLLLGDLYEQVVETIATSRGFTPEQVRALIDRGPFTARQAVAAKLVDELIYRDEFLRDMQKRFAGAELARDYGRRKPAEIDLASPWAFLKLFKDAVEPPKKKAKDVIALVYVEGVITTGTSQEGLFDDLTAGGSTLRRALTEAAEDEGVKAVVLRIDSPGGSALASDIIRRATQVVRKAGKPMVVSMGDTAASGGYYVASGADTIFAEPATITGSIGVVGGKVVLGGLFDKIGITTYTYKFGRHADLFGWSRPFDEHQRQVLRSLMNETYEQFKRCVVDGRGDRLKGDIEELAGGRIYTGRQALAKGLVDRLGGLDDAIRYAAERAKLTDYQIRILPKPKTIFDYLRGAFGLEDEEESVSAGGDVKRWGGYRLDPSLATTIGLLGHLAPDHARAAARMLLRVELLRREPVLMVTPQEWSIR